MRGTLIIVSLIFLLRPAAGAPQQQPGRFPSWVAELRYASSEVFPISIGKFGYPYLPVSVNNQHLELPLDTGNMRRLVFSSEVAARLKLPVTGHSRSYDSSGALRGEWNKYRVESMSALGRSWKKQSAYESDQPNIDGLFGPYYLLDGRFTLDYRSGLLAVSDSPVPEAPRATFLKLLQSPSYPGMPVVEGSVNGRKVLIQIDTGKSRTCVDRALVHELHLPAGPHGYSISEIQIGNWKFSVPSAREEDFSGIGEGLPGPILLAIGSDVLPQVVMTVDYRSGLIRLAPLKR